MKSNEPKRDAGAQTPAAEVSRESPGATVAGNASRTAGVDLLEEARRRLAREDLPVLDVLERAYRKLRERGDAAGELLASAYAVQTIAAAYADFRQACRWVSRLRESQSAIAALSLRGQLVVWGAIVSAAVIVDTTGFDSPAIAAALEQALGLLAFDFGSDASNDVLAVARALLEYCEQQGQPDTVGRVVGLAERHASDAVAGPLILGRYLVYHARCGFRSGAYDADRRPDADSGALLARADAIATRAALRELRFDVCYARVLLAAIRNDVGAIPPLLDAMHEVFDHSRPNCVALYYQHLARMHLMHDKVAQAFEAAAHALRAAELAACVSGEQRSYRVMHALALLASGESDRAIAGIEAMLASVSGRPRAILDCTLAFARACQARETGSSRYRGQLARAMQQAQELNWPLFLNSLPRMAAQLCADALRFGVAEELAGRAIALRKLAPPADADDRWPWPVCVYTLGRFEVTIDGKPLEFSGKAQRKPLELMKLVVVHGARGADSGTVIEELWPDLEGPAARNAFDVALHRLRKLLKHEFAVGMHDGKLAFDPRRVWVDAWSFERICGSIESASSSASAETDAAPSLSQRLLHCYRGHLLAGDDAHWALTARERMRSKLLRAAGSLGHALERESRLDDAILLYRRAIELEPLAEELHRRLMLNYRAQGRIAEALDAYRRCRDLISITLGIDPSPATQAVYRSLKQQL